MKYEHPITVELSLEEILGTVKDKDKVRCVKALIETIMEDGIIGEIRNLVCSASYDD
jgi:hypothetical protein